MESAQLNTKRKVLECIQQSRSALNATGDSFNASTSADVRAAIAAKVCDIYDRYAFVANQSSGELNSHGEETEALLRGAIEDLLFQMSCTPAESRLLDAKLYMVMEKIEQLFDRHQLRLWRALTGGAATRITSDRNRQPRSGDTARPMMVAIG